MLVVAFGAAQALIGVAAAVLPLSAEWDDIAKLAVIATIRTMLNYFLARDITEFEPIDRSGGGSPSA